MAKQYTLFGERIDDQPAPKKQCVNSCTGFRDSWKEAALWPQAANVQLPAGLPSTWLQDVSDPVAGMFCTLCQKYNKVPARSGKAIWKKEPCTLFRLQSVHHHANGDMHQDATHQEINRQLSLSDGGISAAFQQCWQEEETAVCAAMSCVYFLAKEEYHT